MLRTLNKKKLRCPECGCPMVPAKNIDDTDSTFWMECSSQHCSTFVDTYIPQDHQYNLHKDPRKFIGVFGGYGSGKTQATLKDDEKHMLTNPNGMTVVGSAVLSQVEQTYEKDFRKDFPKAFIAGENKSKKTYTLVNGHELLIKSFYDEELLRSMNATRIHIVEASAVEYDIFVQLQARLRNLIATKIKEDAEGNPIYNTKKDTFEFEADWRRCFIESNPSVGWIRDNFLLESKYIQADQKYITNDPNKDFSSHVYPTNLNKFLPEGFEENLAKNKPSWWVNRYLKGSFDYAEGMIYPNVMASFIPSFYVPDHWVRCMAMDYGINDPTSFIFGAIDPINRILYIIGETYLNNRNYKDQAAIYWDAHKEYVPNNNYYKRPVMDGRSINKRNDYDLKTIGDLFKEEGILFNPAKMDLSTRILTLNTFIDSGRIKIFKDKCPNLYKEIVNYKFPERTADGKARGDKPVDKNNHAVNALEFLVMELPTDLNLAELSSYNADGTLQVPEKYRKQRNTFKGSPYNPLYYTSTSTRDRQMEDGYGEIFTGGIDSW